MTWAPPEVDSAAAGWTPPEVAGWQPPEVAAAPDVSHAIVKDPNLVSTTAGGTRGAGLNLNGFSKTDLPEAADVREIYADVSSPAVALPKFTVNPDDSRIKAGLKAAANLGISFPEFAESPLGIATAGAGLVIPRTVAAIYAAVTAKNTVQDAGTLGENWDSLTDAQKTEALVNLGGNALLTAVLAHGTGAGKTVGETVFPKREVIERLAAELRKQNQLPMRQLDKPISFVADDFSREGASSPVPESSATLAAQVALTADPSSAKAATHVTPGGPMPEVPDGLVMLPVAGDQGHVIVNPDKADPQAVADAAATETHGQYLGMGSPVKPADGHAVLQTKNADGVPVQEEVISPTTLPSAILAAQKAVPDGSSEVVTPEQIIAERRKAPSTTSFDPAQIPVREVPVKELKLSADVPNFKSNADETTGVVAGNELAGSYQRLGTAPIVAWERLDGSKEVITGRHRFDLAQRSGETTIPTQIVREADGFTADMAKTFDAESNIRDGQGDVKDYANYFRNRPEIDQAAAETGGLLARAKGQAGFALGKHAGDDLYALYQNGKIAEPKAVAIARAAPGNPDLQALGIHQAAVGRSVPEIINFIKAVGLETGGGAEQIDMFGRNDAALQQAEAMSKRATTAQNEINDQIRAVQGAAKRPEAAAKLGVNVADPAGVLNKISELKGELDRWQNWPLHQDLVSRVKGQEVPAPKVETPTPKKYPNTGVGSPADEYGAIYGPTLSAEHIAKFKEQEGNEFPIESPAGTTAVLKVKPLMLWMETDRQIGNSLEHEVGVAYLKIRSDGTTVLDASHHGRPIDKLAADKLIEFLQKTKGPKQAQTAPPLEILNQVETVEEQRARLAAEAAKAEIANRKSQIVNEAAKPLVGSVGDIGQGDLLGGGDLFAGGAKIKDMTPEGFGPAKTEGVVKRPEIQRLKGETLDQAIERSVGYQIDNGLVKLEQVSDGWKATVKTPTGPLIFRSFQKQSVLNQVWSHLNPDYVDRSNEVAGFGGGKPRSSKPAQAVKVPAAVAKTPPPPVGPIRTALANFSGGFKKVYAPHTIDSGAATVANILRDVNGEKANQLARADEAMHQWRKEFDRTPVPSGWTHDPAQPLPHNYAVIDALERGRTNLPPRYKPLADYFDQAFQDRIKVIQQFAPQALQHLITNYFPHIWKDPQRAAGVMSQVATKLFAGRKEFLKERSLPFFADGLERGLQPISDNPVDLLLAKMHSMDKFIAALKAQAEFKAIGKMKFKYALEQMPDGYQAVDDPAFVIHAPPVVEIKEAFDQFQRAKLGEILSDLGVSYKRVASLGGTRWAEADRGMKEIRAGVGASEDILWHEVGHQIDWKFPELRDALPMRGKSPLAEQLRALVDENHPGRPHNPKSSHDQYLRSTVEKMAEIFRAYTHAPKLFARVAPDVLGVVNKFLDTQPSLRDKLNELRDGGLAIGHESTEVKLGGVLKLGDWIMPDGPAQVMKNYLSPGLSHSGVYRSVRAASNLLNAAQLGLSAFHVGFTSLDAVVSTVEVGLHQMIHGQPVRGAVTVARSPLSPVMNYYTGKAIQRAMLDPNARTIKVGNFGYGKYRLPGINVAISQAAHDYAALAVKGGLRATIDPFWQTKMTRNLVRAVHEGGLAWAKTPLYAPLALVEQAMRPISEYLVPRQKLGVFAQLARSEMDRLPAGADVHAVRAAMARAADATEDRMGQMTYDNLFYNRIAKDLALISFRAYGWQLGKYRHLIGAGADTVANVRQVAGGQMPNLTHRQLYFLALPLVVGAVGGVLHKLFTGQNPQSPMDYFHPSTGQTDANGNPKRLSLPSYMKDLEADYQGVAQGYGKGGLMGAGQGLAAATYHRLNPAVSIMADMLNNKDFYGTQIWDPQAPHGQQMLDQAKFIAKSMEPFSIAGAQKLSQGEASTRDKVLPFIGIVPASKLLTMTPAESFYAESFRAKMPAGSRTAEQSEEIQLRSQLARDLKKATTAGDVPDLQARLIAAGIAGGLEAKGADKAKLTRLAAKVELLPIAYQAKYLPLKTAMAGFDMANDKEKSALFQVLHDKINKAAEANENGSGNEDTPDGVLSNYVKQLIPYYQPPAK